MDKLKEKWKVSIPIAKKVCDTLAPIIKRLVMVGTIVLYIILTFWILWPYNPTEIHSITVLNPNKTVKAGDFMVYEIKFTKHTNLTGVISKTISNGLVIYYTDDSGILPAQKEPYVKIRKVYVPHYADSGKYQMNYSVKYPVNPLRDDVIVRAVSDGFWVVNEAVPGPKGDMGPVGPVGPAGPKGQKGGFSFFFK